MRLGMIRLTDCDRNFQMETRNGCALADILCGRMSSLILKNGEMI
ncbi:hypothetical protein U703_01975 [Rhodobacter capsulatus YW1]|nr:hypothetical protein U703_01975 [Rhodobacter capsulatus YW1]